MNNSTLLRLPLLILLFSCANTALYAQSQNYEATTNSKFITFISGAINPELIPDKALYDHLSRSLKDSGPSTCSNVANQSRDIITNTRACFQLPGVDMNAAEQLANEYLEKDLILVEEQINLLCNEQENNLINNQIIEAFAEHIDKSNSNTESLAEAFFLERGLALLGQEELNTLLNWAKKDLRKEMTVIDIDLAKLLEFIDLMPIQYMNMMCQNQG